MNMNEKARAISACRDAAGRITPTAVWRAARHPDSVLHGEFEWDVARAAEMHWERRASELIRSVRFSIIHESRQIVVPFYVSDPRTDTSSYIATERVATNAALAQQVLRDELDRITSAIRRATGLAATFGLSSHFERMMEQATKIEGHLAAFDKPDGDEARA